MSVEITGSSLGRPSEDRHLLHKPGESGPRMCAKAGEKQTPQSCPPPSAVAHTHPTAPSDDGGGYWQIINKAGYFPG